MPPACVDLLDRHVLGLLVLQADRRGRAGERQDVADLDHGSGRKPPARVPSCTRRRSQSTKCCSFSSAHPFRFLGLGLGACTAVTGVTFGRSRVRARDVPAVRIQTKLPASNGCSTSAPLLPGDGGPKLRNVEIGISTGNCCVRKLPVVRSDLSKLIFQREIHEVKKTIESLRGGQSTPLKNTPFAGHATHAHSGDLLTIGMTYLTYRPNFTQALHSTPTQEAPSW